MTPGTRSRFRPASGVGERMSVSVFGGDFGTDAEAGWRPFLDLAPRVGPHAPGVPTVLLVRQLEPGLSDGARGVRARRSRL